jgi:hypothetical protein
MEISDTIGGAQSNDFIRPGRGARSAHSWPGRHRRGAHCLQLRDPATLRAPLESLEVLIPVSTGGFEEALAALLGKDSGGLSASTIARLREVWADEHTR